MTGPRIPQGSPAITMPDNGFGSAPDHGVPAMSRVLSPDEFDHAQLLTPRALSQWQLPLTPPPFAPKDQVARMDPATPKATGEEMTGLAGVLTRQIIQPATDSPMATALMAVAAPIPGLGHLMAGSMGADIVQWAWQKQQEMKMSPEEAAFDQAIPGHISGEQAAVEAAMLGGGAAFKALKGKAEPKMPTDGGLGVGVEPKPAESGMERTPAEAALAASANADRQAIRQQVVAQREALSGKVSAHMDAVVDAWRSIFAPANRSSEAKDAANILRATTGQAAGAYEQAAFKLDDFRRAIDPLPDADKLAFIDHIEGGKAQVNPEFQKPADIIRQTLDDTRDAIRALGTGKLEHFIEDYFPHIWEDPTKAAEAFAGADALEAAKITTGGKRPMEGSKAFLKERSIPTTAEGIALGLKPVSTNPVDLTLLKLREMQRYLVAHQSLNELKEAGLVQFSSGKAPDGYVPINDNIAKVFGPREGAVTLPEGANIAPEDVGVIGQRIMGQYFAPEPVARVVNNYLSPGLRGNAIYDAYRGIGNTLNQAQLGLSAFHLGFTSLDASVSRAAMGLEYLGTGLREGDFGKIAEGMGNIATTPTAPVSNVLLGRKIRAAYLNPTPETHPDMLALANAVKEAGGRVRQDSFYQNSAPEKMIAAWKEGEYGKATALSLPALFEWTSKPLMEHIVPMQKLGVFGDMATKVLAELPPEATLTDRRAALAKAWDSVDNRMGQMVYDNLFWNKTFKDLSMASVRSVGWNLGTIRELGGGAVDIAKMGKDVLTPGAHAELTHKAAYVAALPLVVGMYGATYQMLRTGEGPSELRDYFYPKTGEVDADGNPERVVLPSYMKDIFAYAGHPVETVEHKVAPLPTMIGEMLANRNFYGDEIRNPDDPVVKQLLQEAHYVGTSFVPFGFRNMAEQAKRANIGPTTTLGNWFGITPAKREDVRGPGQNMMADIAQRRGHDARTPEQVDAATERQAILAGLRGNGADVSDAVDKAITSGSVTPKDLTALLKRAGMTPAQERFKGLDFNNAMAVFNASDPHEQALFASLLVKKIETHAKRGTP